MARRLILDTGVLIAGERGILALEQRFAQDDAVIAAITAAEFLVGVELADETRRPARAARAAELFARIPVEEYTLAVAREHARLLAAVRRAGRPRGAHDLIIAATAVATGRLVVSTDAKARFGDLPGVVYEPLGG